MVKELVIPGVSVEQRLEIVPQPLFPAGIIGLVGPSERGADGKIQGFTNYKDIREAYGSDNSLLVREAKKLFLNGVSLVYAVKVPAVGGRKAFTALKSSKKAEKNTIELTARNDGEDGNRLRVKVKKGGTENHFSLLIIDEAHAREELHSDLSMDPNSQNFVKSWIDDKSTLVTAKIIAGSEDIPKIDQDEVLTGGKNPSVDLAQYEESLEQLAMEPSIDVVYACDEGNPKIHAAVKAHCDSISAGADGALGPRIGIGSVGPTQSLEDIVKNQVIGPRFVLVAPHGYAAAVAGLLSKLNYYESPTFKTLNVTEGLANRYTPAQQIKLLQNGVMPIDFITGRGIAVVKGISSDRQQISVQRVGDRAVRGVKNIADNFIGTLNNARGRMALRERLTEFFLQMEKDGAIVPSVDGKSPAYVVDVYSSQADFSQGIVRVDIAVRPVRAMDYIYATVNVIAF
jgi:hypothetical protein